MPLCLCVPAVQMLKRLIRGHAYSPFCEVNGNQQIDVGEGEAVASNKWLLAQHFVERCKALHKTRTAPFDQLWELSDILWPGNARST